MDLEGIVLNDISQLQKDKYFAWSHLHECSTTVKLIEAESGMVVTGD